MELSLINSLSQSFNYREVEVPLISKKNIKVRISSLLLKDELEFISAMTLTGYKREEKFLKLLFSKIDYESRKSLWDANFDTFLKNVTDPDVNAFTMGIIISTHEEEYEYEWRCPHCGTRNRNIINPINVAKTTYPDCDDLFSCTARIFDINTEPKMKIKASYPSYQRALNLTKYVEEHYKNESAETVDGIEIFLKNFISPIEEVTFYDKEGKEINSLRTDRYNELETLITLFSGLTNKIKRKIKERTEDIIDKNYGTVFEFKTQCANPECKRETEHRITPLEVFLSMILG